MKLYILGPWQWYWKIGERLEADCGVFAEERPGMARSICRAPRYEKEDQWKANACLIAAAPDLLDALKDAQATIDAMLSVIGDHCEPWPGDHQKDWHVFCDSFDRIGEAIEKAEGKEGA